MSLHLMLLTHIFVNAGAHSPYRNVDMHGDTHQDRL
jgi:hypothetical protein